MRFDRIERQRLRGAAPRPQPRLCGGTGRAGPGARELAGLHSLPALWARHSPRHLHTQIPQVHRRRLLFPEGPRQGQLRQGNSITQKTDIFILQFMLLLLKQMLVTFSIEI